MRALVQRVRQATVSVGQEAIANIGSGLVVFIAIGTDDQSDDALYLADKISGLRIFPDAEGRFQFSAIDVDAELLLVSQFTLYADTRKGRRPSFIGAATPVDAAQKFKEVVQAFQSKSLKVKVGRFQEVMLVSLVNDGPVTIWIDSVDRNRPGHSGS